MTRVLLSNMAEQTLRSCCGGIAIERGLCQYTPAECVRVVKDKRVRVSQKIICEKKSELVLLNDKKQENTPASKEEYQGTRDTHSQKYLWVERTS
ncbi:hypothetical protein NDU88_001743 [Pleurodeles waltl]|uniref:Uncharacterized protein n=1 Tax=Pleurodeles waltl TaxID=8319 RepID=A0AAV7Q9P3_PLEWA|nr:hypothetical protein NDU88_001743 [Pleurodeles waltl]